MAGFFFWFLAQREIVHYSIERKKSTLNQVWRRFPRHRRCHRCRRHRPLRRVVTMRSIKVEHAGSGFFLRLRSFTFERC